jgi:hypothetical protein
MDRIPLDKRTEQRRQDALTPIREQRDGNDRRLPRWRQWTQEHDAGKDLSGRAAA